MNCKKCGHSIDEKARFCPACGTYVQSSVWRRAFRFFIYFVLALALLFLVMLFFTEDLGSSVKKQLEALKENRITEAYYGYTSKEFRESNSFDTFKHFVANTPGLQQYISASLSDQDVQNGFGTITATLNLPDEGTIGVLYYLVKEDSKWKIAGLEVTEYQKPGQGLSTATVELIAPVEEQLKALSHHNAEAAYKNFTSRQFQEKTPFDKFKMFLLTHPILTQFTRYDFKEHFTKDDRGVVTVILDPDKEAVPLEYVLVKDNGKWKILVMKLRLPQLEKANPKDLLTTIEDHLELLKKGDVEKAYQFVSDELQTEAPLDVFRAFIKNYPIFFNYQTLHIIEPEIEENIGQVTVELKGEKGSTIVDYVLENEGGQWKINGVHIESASENVSEEDSEQKNVKMRAMIGIIHSFLDALRAGEYEKAYDQYTSPQFKEANKPSDLEKFVKDHPELVQSNSSTFEKLLFNNRIATITGNLYFGENKMLPVEFDLIQNGDDWKVLHLITHPVQDRPKGNGEAPGILDISKGVEVVRVILGTKVNEEGIILNPSTMFTDKNSDLYVNLHLRNGKKGDPVEVLLRHVESDSSVPPVHASILENGDSVLTLVFSPPTKGWPSGSYQIRITADGVLNKTFTFNVE